MADWAQQQTGDAHRRRARHDAGWPNDRPCRRPASDYHAGEPILRGRAAPRLATSLGDTGQNTITIG